MLKSKQSSSRSPDQKVSNIYVPRGASGGQMSPRRDVEAGAGVHDPESCCGCCGCGDTFLTSPTGFAKLAEVTFATLCQFLLLNYGVE